LGSVDHEYLPPSRNLLDEVRGVLARAGMLPCDVLVVGVEFLHA
jgi:hypothetical protein